MTTIFADSASVMSAHPTAFNSYSRDDYTHKVWVRDLATQLRADGSLRADGIDVRLDHRQYGSRRPATGAMTLG
jgi:hypothetical protein